jgi:acetylornithine/succinyldiaminopimelate/putrescine aminotransferase
MKLFDVYPLFDITPVKAEGCYVWDSAGKKYLDLYGGHAVISIGHSHPHYIKKITNQLSDIGFYSNSIQNPLQQELAINWEKFQVVPITSFSFAIRARKPMKMQLNWPRL